jgi:putative membrane protein
LTPFFFAIALWVFGITGFLVMRPISRRALASRAGTWLVAVSGWLPPVFTCVVGGLILYVVVDVGLGLDPTHPWAMAGLLVLAAVAVTSIAHVLRLWLGGVASAVLLMRDVLVLTAFAVVAFARYADTRSSSITGMTLVVLRWYSAKLGCASACLA